MSLDGFFGLFDLFAKKHDCPACSKKTLVRGDKVVRRIPAKWELKEGEDPNRGFWKAWGPNELWVYRCIACKARFKRSLYGAFTPYPPEGQ